MEIVKEERMPEENELQRIKEWTVDKGWDKMFELIKSLWEYKQYYIAGKGCYKLTTGQHKGNEAIIEAMKENTLFWDTCWAESKRGGFYLFIVE